MYSISSWKIDCPRGYRGHLQYTFPSQPPYLDSLFAMASPLDNTWRRKKSSRFLNQCWKTVKFQYRPTLMFSNITQETGQVLCKGLRQELCVPPFSYNYSAKCPPGGENWHCWSRDVAGRRSATSYRRRLSAGISAGLPTGSQVYKDSL